MNYDAKFNLTRKKEKFLSIKYIQVYCEKVCSYSLKHASVDSYNVSCHYAIEHLGMLKESQCQQ